MTIRILLALLGLLIGQAVHAETLSLPLHKFTAAKNVDFRCYSTTHELQLPIPKRWKVRKATLRFSYVNSSALIKANSQLSVHVNGSAITQLPLDPLAPESAVKVDLPLELLQAGYNRLGFSIAQHYTLGCEFPCAPELWTQVKLGEAMLDLEYDWQPLPLAVSTIADLLFDPAIIPKGQVHMITEGVSGAAMTPAGIVASGVGLRFEYRPVDFSVSDQLRAGRDNILIGEKPFVEAFLRQQGITLDVSGPVLKIYHMPISAGAQGQNAGGPDKTHALVVVSGLNSEQLKLAAESFDVLSTPLPNSDEMQVSEFSMPEIQQYTGKDTLVPGEKYPFHKLGFDDVTIVGLSPQEKGFSFRLPSDFAISPNQHVDLDLDFAYAAGMATNSTLNLYLNGVFISSLLLDNVHGALITGYKVSVPTYLFRAGTNNLSFKTVLTPVHNDFCSFIQSEGLLVTLYKSSSLLFPQMPHRIELPRMDLFFVNAFPFTRWPDGFETTFLLTQPEYGVASTMMNLISLMSQKNGYPLFGIKVSTEPDEQISDELIVIGRTDTLPPAVQEHAPITLGEKLKIPYPVFKSADEASALAFSTQKSGIGQDKGLIMQMQSPYKEGRTAMVLTSPSYAGLARLGETLWDGGLQSATRGDLLLVDFDYDERRQQRYGDGWEVKAHSMDTGNHFTTGKSGAISTVDFYLTSYPWLYIIALTTVTLLLSLVIYLMLKRHRAKRLGTTE